MEFEKIKELMNLLDNSSLMDFELKLNDGFYFRMNKYKEMTAKPPTSNNLNELSLKEDNLAKLQNLDQNKKDKIESNETNKTTEINETLPIKENVKTGNIVVSPIVGTFYTSSSPLKPPFVKIGDKIKEGDTLCIIEAMKVMNEIKSQYSGEIAEIFVENEDMVEYNQPLFRII